MAQILVRSETGEMFPPIELSTDADYDDIDRIWAERLNNGEFGDPAGHVHIETGLEMPDNDLAWMLMPCAACEREDLVRRQAEYDNAPGIVRFFRARPTK